MIPLEIIDTTDGATVYEWNCLVVEMCRVGFFFLIERGRRNKSGGYPFRFDTLDTL